MAMITLTGYPCSGKTTCANQIKHDLERRMSESGYAGRQLKVVIISDDSLSLPRSAYDDSKSEKPARGALFTSLQRQLGADSIVIVDALNYIKGFRYQMYCAAREFKLRLCTIHVVATPEICTERNDASKSYKPETLENLIMRYEEPSSMVRWDSPLLTVVWTDAAPPLDEIFKIITEGDIKPPKAGTQAVARAPTDALHILEQTSASIVSALMAAQSAASSLGGLTTISVSPGTTTKVDLPPRTLTLSELQRAKRQFVTLHKKATTLGTTEKGTVDWSEESVAEKFASYLEDNLKQ